MYYFFQATNLPQTEGVKRLCGLLKEQVPQSLVCINGQAKETGFPEGTLNLEDTQGFAVKLRRKSDMQVLLAPVESGHEVILTDLYTLPLLSKDQLERNPFIQLLGSLPKSDQKLLQPKSGSVKFWALSKTIQEAWRPFIQNEIELHYPPCPQPATRKLEEHHSFVIGVISDLVPHSGVETIIQALHQNREILPQVTLIFVGDGPEKKRLQWLVDHLHLRQRVQFVTSQKHYRGFLENFDVFVQTNLNPQGYNAVLIDALAQGIPTIATAIGFNKELLEEDKAGLLYEPQNSHTLAQHLLNLYNHPEWVEHYKQKGPQILRNLGG